MLSVGQGYPYRATHFQNENNMAADGREWKTDSCFKINILWDMANSIPYLVPKFAD
jgi:hypothetical protein